MTEFMADHPLITASLLFAETLSRIVIGSLAVLSMLKYLGVF